MTREHPGHEKRPPRAGSDSEVVDAHGGVTQQPPVLEMVLVCDTVGTLDAVTSMLSALDPSLAEVRIIHKGLGAVCKSDVSMAETGSHLVLGFNVGLQSRVGEIARNAGVEIRLYDVIYSLRQGVEQIAANLLEREAEERNLGNAQVIALFKSSRKGIILGCEVKNGRVAVGNRFRVIGVAGTEYEGTIESLHIGPDAVREARVGQQVGLKISDFKQARVGDWVETYEIVRPVKSRQWKPKPGVQRFG